jgi:hypothetical protein
MRKPYELRISIGNGCNYTFGGAYRLECGDLPRLGGDVVHKDTVCHLVAVGVTELESRGWSAHSIGTYQVRLFHRTYAAPFCCTRL